MKYFYISNFHLLLSYYITIIQHSILKIHWTQCIITSSRGNKRTESGNAFPIRPEARTDSRPDSVNLLKFK